MFGLWNVGDNILSYMHGRVNFCMHRLVTYCYWDSVWACKVEHKLIKWQWSAYYRYARMKSNSGSESFGWSSASVMIKLAQLTLPIIKQWHQSAIMVSLSVIYHLCHKVHPIKKKVCPATLLSWYMYMFAYTSAVVNSDSMTWYQQSKTTWKLTTSGTK